MTGAGAPGAPGIIKRLMDISWINLLVGDMNPLASGRFLNDTFVDLLPANDEFEIGSPDQRAVPEHPLRFAHAAIA